MTIQTISSKRPAKSQRGYSLIELSIALAILSVVIVGSLVGVQRILANNRANNVLQAIPRINAALLAGTSNAPNTTITTTLGANLGAFNETQLVKSADGKTITAIKNEFGGTYDLASNSAEIGGTPANRGYFVYMSSVPQSVCALVANGLSALSNGMWISRPATKFCLLCTPPRRWALFRACRQRV